MSLPCGAVRRVLLGGTRALQRRRFQLTTSYVPQSFVVMEGKESIGDEPVCGILLPGCASLGKRVSDELLTSPGALGPLGPSSSGRP